MLAPIAMKSPSERTTMSQTPVLEIQNLTKHYGGVKALTDAQFRLMPGEHAIDKPAQLFLI